MVNINAEHHNIKVPKVFKVPLIRGGKSTKGNVVASCKECNTKKGYLLHFEWDKEKSSKKS
ncbi:HNH endonuclease [Thermodesulfovibrionales bacterium]|nr:HNH endonuclease [Thermodesulfovibrionales bacterium]